MTRFQLTLGIILTLAVTIGAGAMHGRLTDRWGSPVVVQEAVTSLEALPDEFGPWRLDNSAPLGDEAIRQLQPYSYVSRSYVHASTGQQVTFFILLGPVGPTSVHTPEVCYSSREYSITQPPEPTNIVSGADRRTDQFFAMTLEANSLEGGLLRVYYGWSDGTRWEAAERGRVKYAGLPYLYKAQLATHLPPNADVNTDDPGRQFLIDLLPVLRERLVPAVRR